MRRFAIAAAAVVLLGCGVIAAYLLEFRARSHDVIGSSTIEFVPTLPRLPVVPVTQDIVWPNFGYDRARLHAAPPSRVRPPFRTLWVAGGRSMLEFPPSIAWNRLYVGTSSGNVIAVGAGNGGRAWDFASHRCLAATPAAGPYKHGTVYEAFLNRQPCKKKDPADGEVVALSVGLGVVRWRTRIGASESSPMLMNDLVYVGDWLGKVYALDAETGAVRWSFKTGGAIKGGVASDGRTVYIGSYDGRVYAIDARSGRLRWRASGEPRLVGHGTFYSTPAVAYARVYIGSTDGKVYSFGARTGKLRWARSTGGYVYGSPAVWRSLVLVGSYSHVFYAFDAATGRTRWTFKADGPISGSATVVAGVVYFATLPGTTYGLDATTGRLLWRFHDGKYSPVVADRAHIYLVGYSVIYALVPR